MRSSDQSQDQNGDAANAVRDLVRLGVVQSVDLGAARCVVDLGDDLITGPIPWTAARAGGLKIWTPPTEGEQLLVFAPEGDLERAVAGPSLFCDANAAPAADARTHIQFPDGATIAYDLAGKLDITVIADVKVTAPGKIELIGIVQITGDVSITGDVAVDGKVEATDDVKADTVSLKNHTHQGPSSPAPVTGKPVQ